MIVIDLRETVIVGPLLGILDWLMAGLLTHWDNSVLSVVTGRLLDVLRAHPIQVISTIGLTAVVANLSLLIGSGTPSGAIGVQLIIASLALAGTRLTHSAEAITQTRIYDILVTLVEPPEPPNLSSERREDS
ncbi:hypothetical protein HBNXHr_0603 [Halorhabdus sp. BNX81]|nr:hypothetical protein HBNXHr_0603 [Halorhabdus sp. BNX81]